MTENASVEAHDFTVAPAIIVHLIKSQAGSIGKGVLEAIANSLDSDSTRVDITCDANTLTIQDNGVGMQSRDEVLRVFKVFGFDHTDKHRSHGKFGMGRAQLWNYCRTVWRTGQFALDVDIRERGLKFNLGSNLPRVEGLRITGTFYAPLTNVELTELQREIETLAKYATIVVTFNGKQVNRDATAESWPHETDKFWIRPSDANVLKVYSQGFFVRDYHAGYLGIGGVLVSKLDHPFKVNMSRNDVLQQECPLWKEVRAICGQLSGERTKKRSGVRLTDHDRDFLASQTADSAFIANFDKAIFTLANGRHVNLKQFAKQSATFVSVARKGDRMAESIIKDGTGIIVTPETLARFGVDNVSELMGLIIGRIAPISEQGWREPYYYEHTWLRRMCVYERIAEAPAHKQLEASCIPTKELSTDQAGVARALNEALPYVISAISQHHPFRTSRAPIERREVRIGRSSGADAWTDGSTYVAISEERAKTGTKQHIAGFMSLVMLVLHEHLLDVADSEKVELEADFLEVFHAVALEGIGTLLEGATVAFRSFCKTRDRLSATQARALDRMTPAGSC